MLATIFFRYNDSVFTEKTSHCPVNKSGYRTRSNTAFGDTAIERLIRDTTAKGIHLANYTRNVGGNKKCQIKPKSEWVYNKVEAIVSEEIWNQCNNILNTRRKNKKPQSKRAAHLLSGFIHCSCGNKMYVASNTPKYVCKKCRNKIPITDLDNIYYEQLKGYFLSPDEMAKYLESTDERLQAKQQLFDVSNNEQDKISQEMDKVYQLYIKDKITVDGFGERYRPLEERLHQIKKQTPELQAEIDFQKINYLSSSQIIEEAHDLYSRWPEMERDEKRYIIENITEKITIGNNEISIDLCYLHPSPKIMVKSQRIVWGICGSLWK